MGFKGWDKFAIEQKGLKLEGNSKESTELNKKLADKIKKISPQKNEFFFLVSTLPGIAKDYKNILELQFAPGRKWKFDAYNPDLQIALEYEGIIFKNKEGKTGHTSIVGYTNNCDKYNMANILGWHMLRYTALNYKNVIQEYNLLYERLIQIKNRKSNS